MHKHICGGNKITKGWCVQMTMPSFLRFSGLCSIIAGILFLSMSVWSSISLEEIGSYADLIGMAFLLLGLVGIYLRQMNAVGVIGFLIFIFTFIGAVLWAGHSWVNAFVIPVLEEFSPQILNNPPEQIMTGVAISLYPFFIGIMLFGIVTAWKAILPRWGALLLAVVPILDFIPYGSYVSQPLAGIGFIWLGYSLWKGSYEEGKTSSS
ncbi:hypothetical protein [Brevibacillus sp. H7]|uniref:hypothetical protein n=1 Tax=Brevibacillus sp. H7 TaxID=3349138 RepID=UPI0038015F14